MRSVAIFPAASMAGLPAWAQLAQTQREAIPFLYAQPCDQIPADVKNALGGCPLNINGGGVVGGGGATMK
jgi:hypothetical protein